MCSLHKESRSNDLPFKAILKQLISYWYSTCIFILSLGTCVFSFWFSEDCNLRSEGLQSVKKRFTYPFLSATALFIWRLSSTGSNGLGCCRVDVSVKSLNFIVGSQHSPSSSWSKLQAPNPHHAYLLFLLAIWASVFSALTSTCSYWLKQQPEPLDFSSTIFLSVLSREH